MIIGDRLRILREEKNLTQEDVELRTGLHKCYVSRVENGHTVPSIDTLEKWARALEIPIYHLFYNGAQPPEPIVSSRLSWGSSGKDAHTLEQFRRLFGNIKKKDLQLIFLVAQKMATR